MYKMAINKTLETSSKILYNNTMYKTREFENKICDSAKTGAMTAFSPSGGGHLSSHRPLRRLEFINEVKRFFGLCPQNDALCHCERNEVERGNRKIVAFLDYHVETFSFSS